MNIKDIIEKHTTDGTTDWDKANEEIAAEQTKAIETAKDGLVSKEDYAKLKSDYDKAVESKGGDDNKSDADYTELKEQINELRREKQVETFRKEASANGLTAKQIDVFVKGGTDLQDFDFDAFKREDVEDLGGTDQGNDNNKSKGELDEDKEVEAILKMAKGF